MSVTIDLEHCLYELFKDMNINLIGEIKTYAGIIVPDGWLECNGSEVLIEDYPLLAAALGADHPDPSDPDYISPKWGAPSVYTKFKLPNLKGRVPVGYDSSQTEFNTIGKQDGGKTHTHSTGNCTLNENQIPNHFHYNNIDATDKSSWTGREWVGSDENLFADSTYKWRGGGHYKISVPQTRGTGGGQAHNHGATGSGSNIQPYAVVKYIICAA